MTGYEVANLCGHARKAKAAGVSVLGWSLYVLINETSAMVQFPGGYIAEIHSAKPRGEDRIACAGVDSVYLCWPR